MWRVRLAAEVDIVTIIDDFDDEEGIGSDSLLGELRDLVGEGAIDTVILAVARDGHVDFAPLLEQLKAVPVEIAICEDYTSTTPLPQRTHSVRMLAGLPMSVVAERPLAGWALFQKAALDKIGAVFLIIIFTPIMLVAAMAIVCEDAGPILFYQKRNGWSGRPFTICKFRTMRVSAAGNYLRQTEKNDPRCTLVGRFLRRMSIDELPQLWNVLCGDMSLVGPRPHMDCLHVNQREGCEFIADYAQRQRVKPGLTGWAQIHGCRGAISSAAQMRRRLQYDLYYIEHWSIWLDLQILARTPLCVMAAENAF
jgi:exopolysaccharide biosynthesis polyprenyl glycosylphosphotransferase